MNKKPMCKKLTALVTAACTAAVMCGLPAFAFAADTGVTKEETVYIVTDSTGTQQDVIVSDHLQNKGKVKTIADETNLSDIENVKGEETFKQDGESLTWDAEGNSIYYQGKSENEVPVTMDVVYRLNGKVVSGSELQGKSGRVEIKINYQNDAEYEGTTVPFIVMTGIVVTDDSFKNIKIDHGKVIDDGDKLLVVGMAAPGLAQTLDIGESDLGIGSSVTITGDADKFAVEDMMTVVTNAFFEDIDTDKIDDLDYDDEIKELDKGAKALVDGSDQLYEGLNTLAENMPDLQEGVSQLKDGSDALAKGTNDAKKGAKKLAKGSAKLSKSIKESLKKIADNVGLIKDGADSVEENMLKAGNTLTEQGVAANNGAKQYVAGAVKAMNGAETYANGDKGLAAQFGLLYSQGKISNIEYAQLLATLNGPAELDALLENGILSEAEYNVLKEKFDDQIGLTGALEQGKGALGTVNFADIDDPETDYNKTGKANALQLINSSTAVAGGVAATMTQKGSKENKTLRYGVRAVSGGLAQLQTAITSNLDKNSDLSKGLSDLTKGTSDMADGEKKLASGASQLADGMTKLNDNSDALVDGVDKLGNGADKLRKGMSELYKQGIKKIVDMYNDDLKGTLDSANAMIDAGKGYKTFTRLPSDMDGSVKFIYKTDLTD